MVRIQSPDGDRQRYNEYKRSAFEPSNKPYQYKPYNPTFVGMYGEKQRERRTVTKPDKPAPKPRVIKPRNTFESYSRPLGPDIPVNDMGPSYKESKYEYKEYKRNPLTPYKPRPITPKDHLKSKPLHVDKRSGLYTNNVAYKLNEENNDGLRHWNYGYVDDTVAAKRSKPKPKDKYDAPKAKEAERKTKPVVAAAAITRSTPPPPPPPRPQPVTKSYKTSSTQHVDPGVKTTTTQTQASKTRSFGTQSEPDKQTPLPVVAPVPVKQPMKKVKTKSQGIQCSETPRKAVTKGTQFESTQSMKIQTPVESTYVPLQARKNSPEYAELARRETPVYSRRTPPTFIPIVTTAPDRQTPAKQRTPIPADTRWTPSPEVAQNNAYDNAKTFSPMQPTYANSAIPEVSSYPTVSKSEAKPEMSSYQAVSKSGRKPFPYQAAQSRLPPEITACIEAYDVAHGPI